MLFCKIFILSFILLLSGCNINGHLLRDWGINCNYIFNKFKCKDIFVWDMLLISFENESLTGDM